MIDLNMTWAAGFAVITAAVLIAVAIYTVIKVRKQAREAKADRDKAEKKKSQDQLDHS